MDQSLARREALRIWRLVLIVQLAFLAMSFLALPRLGVAARVGVGLRAVPTLILALLFLPPWLERFLGRSFLAVGLGLSVLFSSLETAYIFADWTDSSLAHLALPLELIEPLAAAPPVEPFFFLLIPLVLLAWGYGRKGALLGSTWAAVLHVGISLSMLPEGGLSRLSLSQMLMRIVLLYLVPLIVSILAERERQQHARLEKAHQRLRRHAVAMEQLAVSRERNRMARDLHDTLAHSLSALTVQLEALRTLMDNEPAAARAAVDDIADLARRGLEESRKAIQALRSDPVETLGLAGALRETIQGLEARAGFEATLSTAGEESAITPEEAQALYRIAEEALSNVERHAGARQVDVRIDFGADRVDLVVRDDGTGFDPETVRLERYGLTGMRERAAMIGASVALNSRPGGGTEVRCVLER
ncbi:MAG: sensor histidine kinase [Anaerolineae bacterium]|jgi:signal transduction histidine kinase